MPKANDPRTNISVDRVTGQSQLLCLLDHRGCNRKRDLADFRKGRIDRSHGQILVAHKARESARRGEEHVVNNPLGPAG